MAKGGSQPDYRHNRAFKTMNRPLSFVQIDTRQAKISRDFAWKNEYERPIYFTELRDNRYACSWCQLDGRYLFLIPSPHSHVQIRQVRYPQDAEIIGRVTVITMRIAETRSRSSDPLLNLR